MSTCSLGSEGFAILSVIWTRRLLIVLLVSMALPWAPLRAAVLTGCVIFVAFSEAAAGGSIGDLRFPAIVSLLVVWSGLTVFWSGDFAGSALAYGQFFGIFGLVCYIAFKLRLQELHLSAVAAFKWLTAGNILASGLETVGLSIHEVTLTSGAQGLLANPNLLAFVGVVSVVSFSTLPVSFYRSSLTKWSWFGLGAMQVLIASSNAGFVYLAIVILLAFGFWVAQRGSGANVAVLLVSAVPVPFILVRSVQETLLDVIGLSQNPTMSGRTVIWELAMGAIADRPLTGYGIGGLRDLAAAPPKLARLAESYGLAGFSAHNGYLDVALQLGLVGLALTLIAMMIALTRYLRLHRVEVSANWGALMLVAVLVYNLSEARFVSPPLAWLILCLLVVKSIYLGVQNHSNVASYAADRGLAWRASIASAKT